MSGFDSRGSFQAPASHPANPASHDPVDRPATQPTGPGQPYRRPMVRRFDDTDVNQPDMNIDYGPLQETALSDGASAAEIEIRSDANVSSHASRRPGAWAGEGRDVDEDWDEEPWMDDGMSVGGQAGEYNAGSKDYDDL